MRIHRLAAVGLVTITLGCNRPEPPGPPTSTAGPTLTATALDPQALIRWWYWWDTPHTLDPKVVAAGFDNCLAVKQVPPSGQFIFLIRDFPFPQTVDRWKNPTHRCVQTYDPSSGLYRQQFDGIHILSQAEVDAKNAATTPPGKLTTCTRPKDGSSCCPDKNKGCQMAGIRVCMPVLPPPNQPLPASLWPTCPNAVGPGGCSGCFLEFTDES